MIDREGARRLMERYSLHEDIVRHSEGVARVAFDLARAIAAEHPELGVSPERVEVAALLHDIGRARPGRHEFNTLAILREEGLEELADIALHGTLYEASVLEGRPDESLLPRSIEQKILCYADLRFCQRPMTVHERIADAIARRNGNPATVRVLELAEKRWLEMEEEIQDLARGCRVD